MQRKRVDVVSVKMIKLELVKEGAIHYLSEEGKRKMSSPKDAYDLVKEIFKGYDREVAMLVCLNIKNEPLNISTISVGSINSSIIHPREVLKTAILSNAYSMIIYHNHPSGDISPSKEDIDITKRLKEASEIIGIKIVDHIILGDQSYLSFKEQGII